LEILVGYLKNIDGFIFQLINQVWINPLFDKLMVFITEPKNTILFGFAFICYIVYRRGVRGFYILIGCLIAVGLADATAARIIKPIFNRSRPHYVEKNVRLIVPDQSSQSFPSNHAANCFAGATFLSYLVPEAAIAAFSIAALVAYSRVYVGVHYFGDVLGGAILGILIGIGVFFVY